MSYGTGVTGQSIPPAGIYPGLKRPRLDYTWVYYGLGQIIPRGILCSYLLRPKCTLTISTTISIVMSDTLMIYLIFQQVSEDSALSGKLNEKAKITKLKS